MLWFKDGDKNTVFLSCYGYKRNNYSGIRRLRDDNVVFEDSKLIEDHILDFYKNSMLILILMLTLLFLSKNLLAPTFLPWFLLRKSRLFFLILMVIVSLVLMVLVVSFILLVGRLLRKMFAKVVQQIFNQNWILHGIISNVVSLIPNIQGTDSIKDFKFNIISKILANRLAVVASKIISPNQYGFVKGMDIHEC